VLTAWRTHGARLTGPRRAVVAVLAEATEHLSAPQIVERLRRHGSSVDRASIYRALADLERAHLAEVRATAGLHGTTRRAYRLGDPTLHHGVCTDCGRVVPMTTGVAAAALTVLEAATGFRVAPGGMEVHGRCTACADGAMASSPAAAPSSRG
jgi:Fe2+ or Zn2+ uptake regulation protein